jgi:hypothetical protein
MACAKQHNDTVLSWFQSWAVRPTRVCSGRYIAVHRGACRGELQARWERRRNLQVPEVWLRQSANIVDEGGNVQVSSYSSSPCGQGTASSFYRLRGDSLQSCHMVLSATYGGMAHNVVELMVVVENLASGGRRGESCACSEATSRVAAWKLLVWSPSVCRLEGWADGRPEAA